MLLGDVVVSYRIMEYDFGKWHLGGVQMTDKSGYVNFESDFAAIVDAG